MKKGILIQFIPLLWFSLSSISYSGNVEDGVQFAQQGNFDQAHALWLIEAEKGDPVAQFNLGVMYSRGDGVPQDEKKVAIWYHLAAEQGYADAQHNLGIMYEKGLGLPRDFKEAVKWYRLAAEQGHPSGQNNLGFMYYQGNGVLKNFEQAYAWWTVAAANGNEQAHINMKVCQNGEMTPSEIEGSQQIVKQIRARFKEQSEQLFMNRSALKGSLVIDRREK